MPSDEDMWPKAKQLATEEKVADAFKNLNLDTTITQRSTSPFTKSNFDIKDYEKQFNLYDDNEDSDDCSGILLSNELKQTLEISKKNSDFELLKKISDSRKE